MFNHLHESQPVSQLSPHPGTSSTTSPGGGSPVKVKVLLDNSWACWRWCDLHNKRRWARRILLTVSNISFLLFLVKVPTNLVACSFRVMMVFGYRFTSYYCVYVLSSQITDEEEHSGSKTVKIQLIRGMMMMMVVVLQLTSTLHINSWVT